MLLVKPVGKGKKRWQIPQIEVSAGENFEEAAHRQALEETGIDADDLNYLGFVDYPKRRLHCFIGHARGGAPQVMRLEIQDAQFFTIEETQQLLDKRSQQLVNGLSSMMGMLKHSA